MRATTLAALGAAGLVAAVGLVAIPDWHPPPPPAQQIGYDGAGMAQFVDRSPWRVLPAPASVEPAAETGGPAATATYKDVQVLTDVSAAEFMRLQRAMTAWVSPQAGCAFCHQGEDWAAPHPMKDATREMIRMTRRINTTWRGHVGEAGATCFTCHHGEPVPPETWLPQAGKPERPFGARAETWNEAGDTVRKFFPTNGWALYLLGDEPIRAESITALRSNTVAAQIDVKRIYEMMMQMSDGIGVNCGFCHNSRSFSDWSQSTPARWFTHDAFRMMRDLNAGYMASGPGVPPQTHALVDQNRLALPLEDRAPIPGPGLSNCATCHYGHLKPDGGAATVARFEALASVVNADPSRPASILPSREGADAVPPALPVR